MKKGIQQTLNERGKIHGDFTDHAHITQSLKLVMQNFIRNGEDRAAWEDLSLVQQEALEMIVHKIGRILSGNPDHEDHWHDIAGYATLAEHRCKTT